MVSGCFDLLHAGHIAFLQEAASHGRLIIALGSDGNVGALKDKPPTFSQDERRYILKHVDCVDDVMIGSGTGMLDFEPELRAIKPDIFFVNHDGHRDDKKQLCDELGVTYVVSDRIPAGELPARSSSATKRELRFPYRLALAGGWIDQPWVSQVHPGSMVVASLVPTVDFNERAGMATSSRNVGIRIWGDRIPDGDPVQMARILFGAENPPGSPIISGSQDQIGLLVPGISKLYYDGDYWPTEIETTTDAEPCRWLEEVIHLVPLEARPDDYDPLVERHLDGDSIRKLGESGERCFESIRKQDVEGLGRSLTQSLEAWREILPHTVLDSTLHNIGKYVSFPGATFSGCGGGYIIVVSEQPIEGAIRINVRK